MNHTLPTLKTDRLILDSFTETDAADVAKLTGDKRVVEMTASLPYPYEMPFAVSWIKSHLEKLEKDQDYIFAIRLKSNSQRIIYPVEIENMGLSGLKSKKMKLLLSYLAKRKNYWAN